MPINPMQPQMSPDMLMAMMTDPRGTPQQRMAAMSALNAMRGGANAPVPPQMEGGAAPPQMTGDSTGVSQMSPAFMAAVRQEIMGQGPEQQPEIQQRQAAPEAPQNPSTAALMSGAADAGKVASMARGGAVRRYADGTDGDDPNSYTGADTSQEKEDPAIVNTGEGTEGSNAAMLAMLPKSMRDAITKDVTKMSAQQPLDHKDAGMALLQTGLAIMKSASQPGARFLGSIGEGGAYGLNELQKLQALRAQQRLKSIAAESGAIKSAVSMLPWMATLKRMKAQEGEPTPGSTGVGGPPAQGGGGNAAPPFMDPNVWTDLNDRAAFPNAAGTAARQALTNMLRYGYTGTDNKSHFIPGSVGSPEYQFGIAGGNAAATAANTPRLYVPRGQTAPVFGYPPIVGSPPGAPVAPAPVLVSPQTATAPVPPRVSPQTATAPVPPRVSGIKKPPNPIDAPVPNGGDGAAIETPTVDPDSAAIKTVMPKSPKDGGYNIESKGPTAEVDPLLLEQKKTSLKRDTEASAEDADISHGLNQIRAMGNLLKLSQSNPYATTEAGFVNALNEGRRQFGMEQISLKGLDPAAVGATLKKTIDEAMSGMRGMNSRWTQSELGLKMKSILSPDALPQTNFNVLVSTAAELEQKHDMINSWKAAQKSGWKNRPAFEEEFRNKNPIDLYEESVARRTGNFYGMPPDFNRTAKGTVVVGKTGNLFQYNGKDENGDPILTIVKPDYLGRTPALKKTGE